MTIHRSSLPCGGCEAVYVFRSAEEAWIWGVQGMLTRLAGGRTKPGMAVQPKICEASDIISCAHHLHRDGKLTGTELEVMFLYGRHAVSPASLGAAHRPAVELWRAAMAKLSQIMEQKGIISSEHNGGQHG